MKDIFIAASTYTGMAVLTVFYVAVISYVLLSVARAASLLRCRITCSVRCNGNIKWHLVPLGFIQSFREMLNEGMPSSLTGKHNNGLGGYTWEGIGKWSVWQTYDAAPKPKDK